MPLFTPLCGRVLRPQRKLRPLTIHDFGPGSALCEAGMLSKIRFHEPDVMFADVALDGKPYVMVSGAGIKSMVSLGSPGTYVCGSDFRLHEVMVAEQTPVPIPHDANIEMVPYGFWSSTTNAETGVPDQDHPGWDFFS